MDTHPPPRIGRFSVSIQSSIYFLAIYLLQTCCCYNLESRLPLFKFGPKGSTFGFSTAQHRTTTDNLSGMSDTLLVVGAPTADALLSQPGAVKPGGVFYCPVSTDPYECSRVVMDEGGESKASIKSDQWLGVSLKSQGPGQMLVSCAHRWRQHFGSGINEQERVCGKCFLLNVTQTRRGSKIDEILPDDPSMSPGFVSSPCDQIDQLKIGNKRKYGYMQAGTSLDIHDKQYLLGAPGAWRWTGSLFDIGMPDDAPSGIAALLQDSEATMYRTQTCFDNEISNDASKSKCLKLPVKRDSYMGFSVATSSAIGTDSEEMYYVAGSPRGNNTGAVLFFKLTEQNGEKWLTHIPGESVTGDSIASSFGFSIALTDINDDGLDELIVGAPQYYQYTNEGKRGGAVYIYMNKPDRGFSEVGAITFYGPLDSFFGYSVTALGDIDQDGVNDFAVGAPYEKENGAVHIYRGSRDGKIEESQVLNGKEFIDMLESGREDIRGFGSSLSGAVDADSNKYPDLLIGSLSDHVALFRARPIISVTMTFEVRPKEIDLESTGCSRDGESYACFEVRYCFVYVARHGEYTEDVKIKYKLKLDTIRQKEKKSSRVHFESPDGPSTVKESAVIPSAGTKICPGKWHRVFFSNNVEDKLSNIGVHFEFDLDWKKIKREDVGQPVFPMIDDPILDADLDREKDDIVTIKNNCGTDGCDSNLSVGGSMPSEIIVGDDTTVTLTLNVSNSGEEAHQAYVIINTPQKVDYDQFEVTESSGADVQCYAASSGEFIRCDLGNPYKTGSEDIIEIQLGVSRLTALDRVMEVQVSGHTTSNNPTIAPISLQSMVLIELDISLTVQSQPQQVQYPDKDVLGESAVKDTKDIGPLVVYTFNIVNEANQPAAGVELNVKLPHEIKNGKWLLYLLSTDVTSGGPQATGSCDSSDVNVLEIEPPEVRSKRSAQEASPFKAVAQASSAGGSHQSVMNLDCQKGTANCIVINCKLDELYAGTTTSVIFQAYVWEATFIEEFKKVDLVYIFTSANVRARNENVRFKGDKTSGTIRTTVDHDIFRSDVSSTFPWWYILIGVIVLLIIYIVIIIILVKCGFFRRKKYHRADDEDEDVCELHPDERKERDESNM